VRVLLVVSSSKHTGAAAVAELCCRSLAAAAVDARLLFVAGNNLEERLRRQPWAVPGLVKERRPRDLRANLALLRTAAAAADAVVCHLAHDQILGVLSGAHRHAALVRAFRNPRSLRTDLLHRWFSRRLRGALLAHAALEPALATAVGDLPSLALPVPLEERFRPGADPNRWRRRLAIPPAARVLGMVGKLAPGRGFELLLETAARVTPPVQVLAVGHGEAEAELRRRAEGLGLADRVAWAGYQERELPELYAAMDLLLFAAPGSDHGHRTISEAQGCGRPVVAAALPGVEDLIRDGVTGCIAAPTPKALAQAVTALLANPDRAADLARAATAAVEDRRLAPSGTRLAGWLEALNAGRNREPAIPVAQPSRK
jgi:glycosyltransferase involved in cell wall biosynthesis